MAVAVSQWGRHRAPGPEAQGISLAGSSEFAQKDRGRLRLRSLFQPSDVEAEAEHS